MFNKDIKKMRILPLLTLIISVAEIALAPDVLAQEKQFPENSTSFMMN